MVRKTVDRPAFLMYAANVLAKREFRSMTLAQRGLWITMVLECWPNQEIPNECNHGLADYLGRADEELTPLLPAVMWYFEQRGEDLFCPTLEKYRDEVDARHEKQKAGGKKGAAKTNESRNQLNAKDDEHDSSTPTSTPTSTPKAPRRGSSGSLDQTKPNQTKTKQPGKDLPLNDKGEIPAFTEWMNEGSGKSASSDYERASNGY